MTLVRIDDWTALAGLNAEVRIDGRTVCSGRVDAVTADGEILWVSPIAGTRQLFERADSFEAWAVAENAAVCYRINNSGHSFDAALQPHPVGEP